MSRCPETIWVVLAIIIPWCPARTGPPRTPWATTAASVIGSSRAMSSGEKAATPNAAAAVRRMPTAWVTDPPGSSANTSGSGRAVTSPPEPVPTAAAAATARATAMTSLERISAQSSSSSLRVAPRVAGHSRVANTSGARATTM